MYDSDAPRAPAPKSVKAGRRKAKRVHKYTGSAVQQSLTSIALLRTEMSLSELSICSDAGNNWLSALQSVVDYAPLPVLEFSAICPGWEDYM